MPSPYLRPFLQARFLSLLVFFVLVACNQALFNYDPDRWVRTQKANLRTDPLTLSSVIEVLEQNRPLEVLSRTKKKVEIGRDRDHWYYVRLENGIEGWVYGASLARSPLSPPRDEESQEKGRLGDSEGME